MVTIENIIRPGRLTSPPLRTDTLLRFGFFGQISALKGIDILFEAARMLDDDGVTGITFEIHGDYLGQPAEFQTAFLASLETASRNIRFIGPYDQDNVDRLMSTVDAVLVPSIWWENSPVVIQESLRNDKPVICSDIGGMAEMVRDGRDGFHFPAGNAMALADLLKRILADRTMLTGIGQTINHPPEAEEIVQKHIGLYQRLLEAAVK
ncbi:MAG: glycosyltransferase [Acidiphilium sp.]|nr:glycosyltransferase [Acidiphilium sp.]MDD4936969.1 glycosyltransferase [Acidiphilium sp.]